VANKKSVTDCVSYALGGKWQVVLPGVIFRSPLFFERYCRGIIKRSDGSQGFRIEALQRTAMQTGTIRRFLIGKRAAQLLVPATENFAHDSDFVTKYAVCSV
jgi:hypothetical protein